MEVVDVVTAADSYELVWRRQRQRGFVVELREFDRRRQCRVVFFFWFKVCGARISMSPFHADDVLDCKTIFIK